MCKAVELAKENGFLLRVIGAKFFAILHYSVTMTL